MVDNFDYKSPDDFAEDDFRRTVPKFQGENFYLNKAIVEKIKALAVKKGCKTTQLALAWVIQQGIIPLVGTTRPERLEENWQSNTLELSKQDMDDLRKIVDEAKPIGDRFSEAFQSMVGH